MMLTMQQAADRLGKTRRQVRYLIEQGRLKATKLGRTWRIDSDDVPRTPGQDRASERKQAQLLAAVEDALDVPANRRRRYSIRDLRAFKIAAPLYQRTVAHCGTEHAACHALRQTLEHLARGCHRFRREDKAREYERARDSASAAACELALMDTPDAMAALETIEQELMAALAGLLRRLERRKRDLVATA